MLNEIQQYEDACDAIRIAFIKEYYTYDDGSFQEHYWIGSEIGGVCGIGDEFWCLDDMVNALRLEAPREKLLEWYWDGVEGKREYNLKAFLCLKDSNAS